MTGPTKNGVSVYGVTLPDDFNAIVLRLADEAKCLPHDVIVRLAVQGERCARNHEAKEPRP